MIQVIYGENNYELTRAAERVIAAFVETNGDDSIQQYDAETVQVSDLPQILQGQSLFSSASLVVLNQPSANKTFWEGLGDFLESHEDVDLLILDTKPDKRTRTFKWLQANAEVREYKTLDEHDTATWLQTEARRQGVDCNPEMARYLVEYVGTDQWRLYNDVAKLALTGKPLSRDLITEIIEPNPQASAFDLLDAILKGNRHEASRLIQIVKQYEDPYKFLGLLASQLYALAVCVTAENRTSQQIAKDAGIHPYVAQKTLALARSVDQERLRNMVRTIESCDRSLKTSGSDPWLTITAAVGHM